MECSDDHLYSVLDDPGHLSLSPASLSVISISALIQTAFGDPHFYGISVDSTARAALRYKQVSLKSFDSYESETPGVAVESACKYLFSLVLSHLLLASSLLLLSSILSRRQRSCLRMAHCFAQRKTLLQNIAGVQMITHSASVPAYSAVRKMLLRTAAYSEG